MESNNIGKRIEQLRKEKGETQQQLADAVGVKRETIYQWESNTRDLKTKAIIGLAEHFEVSADWILGISSVKGRNADIKMICEYTGLSEDSILTLHRRKGNTARIIATDQLLKDDEFIINLTNYIWAFVLLKIPNSKYAGFPIKASIHQQLEDVMYATLIKYLPKFRDSCQTYLEQHENKIDQILFEYIQKNIDIEDLFSMYELLDSNALDCWNYDELLEFEELKRNVEDFMRKLKSKQEKVNGKQ